MIIQGGNAPIAIVLSKYPSEPIQQAIAQLKQGDVLKKWVLTEMIFQGEIILLPLTQEDTYSFNEGVAYLEFKYDIGGNVWLSAIEPIYVSERNNKEVFEPSVVGSEITDPLLMNITTNTIYLGEAPSSGVNSLNGLQGNVVISPGNNVEIENISGKIVVSAKSGGVIVEGTKVTTNGVFQSAWETNTKQDVLSIGDNLEWSDGKLNVKTTNEAEADNTLPITSAGVNTQIGNIKALLETI